MVQNVNTALQQERQNVALLMTYRADNTDITYNVAIPNNLNGFYSTYYNQDPKTGLWVSKTAGVYGLGGQYGVYYNPDISLVPFQEIFDYDVRNGEKWFKPVVMSVNRCSTQYGGQEPARPSGVTMHEVSTKRTYTATFCGDLTNTTGSNGITRTIGLGQWNSASKENASQINDKFRFPGDTTGSNKHCVQGRGTTVNSVVYADAIQCWRYNFAPWYPGLRYTFDISTNAQNNGDVDPAASDYYNKQFETAQSFGTAAGRSPDYIGVQINYNHPWLLSFFPGPLPLSDRAVKIMEPSGGSFTEPK